MSTHQNNVYWEPILLSTLKVSKFRASVLLIGDLLEVSTRPLHWVCVHAWMCACMCPTFYRKLLSAVLAAFTVCHCGRVGALFKGGMYPHTWLYQLLLMCPGKMMTTHYVWYAMAHQWWRRRQTNGRAQNIMALLERHWRFRQNINSWSLHTSTVGYIDKKQHTFTAAICVTPSD